MSIRVVKNPGTVQLVVGRVFSLAEARELRSRLRAVEAAGGAEIDFSGTAEVHPVALAALVELAAEARVELRTRGLGVAHRRLLAYLGAKRPAQGSPSEEPA